jgi:diguanylate cyclase (GGDEF)-like protein
VRVLIADDETTSRLVVKAMVARLGHEALVAEDGDAAWRILQAQEVDVLLTDWMMPGMDGPELCRRARTLDTGRYVYVVLITSLDCPDQVLEGMTAGADDYLVKPVDPLVLRTRLVAAERVTELHRQVAHFQTQLERANRDLLGQSLTDALTGLGNRRRMEQDLQAIHERALRSGQSYGIAMFDVDHFKVYNDRYGHPEGDEVLRRVAQAIAANTRAGEETYRYGGEEFLLVAAEAKIDEVEAAAERVRRAVEATAIAHAARPSAPYLVTVSAGVAGWTATKRPTGAEVLDAADQALFAAKAGGRNRVCQAAGSATDQLHAG